MVADVALDATTDQWSTWDTLRHAAIAWHAAGFSTVPIKLDGTKRPTIKWEQFIQQLPTDPRHRSWWPGSTTRHQGLAVICGAVSGGLEMLELEGRATTAAELARVRAAMDARGVRNLWDGLFEGNREDAYLDMTPHGGVHLWYRISDHEVPGNQKIARRPAGDRRVDVYAETRGEGGYAIVAPTPGPACANPDTCSCAGGGWTLLSGTPGVVPVLTWEQREALVAALHEALDEMPVREPVVTSAPLVQWERPAGYLSPGDDFESKVSWGDILGPYGWTVVGQTGRALDWCRPGKTGGMSATTGRDPGRDRLYVFSTSTEFEAETPYTKFGAYALLEHGGDHAAAAKALAAAGYGDKLPRGPRVSPPMVEAAVGAEVAVRDEPAGVVAQVVSGRTAPAVGSSVQVTSNVEVLNLVSGWLGTGGLWRFFRRASDGKIMYVRALNEDGGVDQETPAGKRAEREAAQPVTPELLTFLLSRTYGWYRMKKVGSGEAATWEEAPCLFPKDLATLLVAGSTDLEGLRELRSVATSPMLRRDWTVLDTPGYDEESEVLYLPPPGLDMKPVSEMPSDDEVAAAREMLLDFVADFPFLSEHDLANCMGMLLTPLLRESSEVPFKLFAINARQPGTGKTLMAKLVQKLHGGIFKSEIPREEKEVKSTISSILDQTVSATVVFDNVTGIIKSSTMAGLLTSRDWDDRLLGGNTMLHATNDRMWMITGNNIQLGGDLIRRTITITIDPKEPNPERRENFRHPKLEQHAETHRGELLWALLTIIRNWAAQGKPTQPGAGSDSYATWVAQVRGILAAAGFAGIFDAAESRQQEASDDDDDWGRLLEAIHAEFGTSSWTTEEMMRKVATSANDGASLPGGLVEKTHPIPLSLLPEPVAEKILRHGGVGLATKTMGRWISNREGRWCRNLTVVKGPKGRDGVSWHIAVAPGIQVG